MIEVADCAEWKSRLGAFSTRSQVFASTAGAKLFVASEASPGKFATGANGRRAPEPGTFMILVVARQAAK